MKNHSNEKALVKKQGYPGYNANAAAKQGDGALGVQQSG